MSNIALVRSLVERILLAEDLQPVLHLLADDVEFTVAVPDGLSRGHQEAGKDAVIEYFNELGDIVTFWRVKFFDRGEHVVVVGNEGFAIQHTDITASAEFALVFEVCDGLITRLLVIEDLAELLRDGSQLSALRDRLETDSAANGPWRFPTHPRTVIPA
jgi:ketosteroid isomerase-like protein